MNNKGNQTKTYVLQTIAGKETYVRDLLNASDQTSERAKFWVPLKNRYWKSNQSELAKGAEPFQLKKDVLLPGYVLAETDDPYSLYQGLRALHIKTRVDLIGRDTDRMEALASRAANTSGSADRLIEEFNDSILAVTEKELDWIRALTGEISEVEYIDKKIHFVSGPMVGMDGYVRRADKRKRMLMVEMPFFQDSEINIWVAFDEVRVEE